jgi:hypothetical protein
MKKSLYLLIVNLMVVAMIATAAQAQQQVNFSDLPLAASPTPVPLGYQSLNWANMFYVDPTLYTNGGPGYQNLLTHRDVVFVGGQFCAPLQSGCFGIISVPGGPIDIQVNSAIMSAGFENSNVTFNAYQNGTFKGSMTTKLSTIPSLVHFPVSWGAITELQILANQPGNVVLLDLSFYRLGG